MKFNFGVVTTIISLLIGVIGLLFAYSQISKKEISYEIIYSIPTVNIIEPIKNHKFDIRIDNKKKTNIFTTLIRVKNTGNVSIEKSDFIKPIVIKTKSIIYSSSIVNKNPSNYNPLSKTNKNSITLNFDLMNKDDWFLMEIITTKDKPVFEISARIKNIDNIINNTNKEKDNRFIFSILLFSFSLLSISQTFLQASWIRRNKEYNIIKLEKTPYAIISLSLIVGKYATLFVGTWYFTSSSLREWIIMFTVIYGITVFLPGIIYLFKKTHNWVTFPENIALQTINPKKKSS